MWEGSCTQNKSYQDIYINIGWVDQIISRYSIRCWGVYMLYVYKHYTLKYLITRSSSSVNFWSQDWLLIGLQLVCPTTVLSSFRTALISSEDITRILHLTLLVLKPDIPKCVNVFRSILMSSKFAWFCFQYNCISSTTTVTGEALTESDSQS